MRKFEGLQLISLAEASRYEEGSVGEVFWLRQAAEMSRLDTGAIASRWFMT